MKALVYYGPKDLRLTDVDDLKVRKGEVLLKLNLVEYVAVMFMAI